MEKYTKFFQKFWAQNEIAKFFVKNQFCWTFRSALTLSSKSLATDVNTILYKLRFFGVHKSLSFGDQSLSILPAIESSIIGLNL